MICTCTVEFLIKATPDVRTPSIKAALLSPITTLFSSYKSTPEIRPPLNKGQIHSPMAGDHYIDRGVPL